MIMHTVLRETRKTMKERCISDESYHGSSYPRSRHSGGAKIETNAGGGSGSELRTGRKAFWAFLVLGSGDPWRSLLKQLQVGLRRKQSGGRSKGCGMTSDAPTAPQDRPYDENVASEMRCDTIKGCSCDVFLPYCRCLASSFCPPHRFL